MGEIIYAARMKEYNKKKGHLRRNLIINGRHFEAGNATKGQRFVPSSFVIVSEKEARELLKKHHDGTWEHHQPGRPYLAVFDVYKVGEYKELLELAQQEADYRASTGVHGARAMIAGTVAKVLTDKPVHALHSMEQVEAAPPVPEAKIDDVDDVIIKDSDPFENDTPIEGLESTDEGVAISKDEDEKEATKDEILAPKSSSKKKKKITKKSSGRPAKLK